MWRVEMAKMRAQARARVMVLACLLGPVLFVLVESAQSSTPGDTLFGRWIHESGFADSLLTLGFSTEWLMPFVIVGVAGDIFAEEDRLHTWSLLLTRSRSRQEVLAGKFLAISTYSLAVTIMLGLSATLSGAVIVGTQPLVSLDGTVLSASTAWAVTTESWATVLPPVLAIMAIALLVSVISRNSWVGVIVPLVIIFLFNVISQLSAIDPVRPFLPTTGFDSWYGLARTSVYTNQIWASLEVSAAWVVVLLVASSLVFLRRDVVDA
jgi:ABC-2 type transport system permease protein